MMVVVMSVSLTHPNPSTYVFIASFAYLFVYLIRSIVYLMISIFVHLFRVALSKLPAGTIPSTGFDISASTSYSYMHSNDRISGSLHIDGMAITMPGRKITVGSHHRVKSF